jgi:hypothetical protein
MDKIKIVYAASNTYSAKLQLERFVAETIDKPYTIKLAAYKKSSPSNISIDWTLDCLYNMFRQGHISTDNQNFEIYYNHIKSFDPDLIISDLEYFTSHIANTLNTKLWQCSSSLINFALTKEEKHTLGLYNQFAILIYRNPVHYDRQVNMINNSDDNFIYSYLGDAKQLNIQEKYQWIRPYHLIGKKSKLSQHDIVGATIENNQNILKFLHKTSDSVLFSENYYEKYTNIISKELHNDEEYISNLYNSTFFVNGGQSSFLADAYYNKKFSFIIPDYNDLECIINSVVSDRYGLGRVIHDPDTCDLEIPNINILYDNDVKFLHERIDELCT